MANTLENQRREAEGVAETLGGAAKEKLDQARDAIEGYYEDGVEQVKKMEASLESYIKDNPLRSLLIAAGVSLGAGFLVATLIKR